MERHCRRCLDNPKMDLAEKIERIELKVKQLALKRRQLQRENASLLAENQKLKVELERADRKKQEIKTSLRETSEALERRIREDSQKSEKLQLQIDHYVKEIDKCIEWLTNN